MNESITNGIVCSKCGTTNAAGTNFCINCGNNLQPQNVNNNQNITNVNENNTFQVSNSLNNVTNDSTVTMEQSINPVGNLTNVEQNLKNSTGSLNYLQYIIGAILKPFDKFKNEENKLSDFKNVSILALIMIGTLTILNLITTILTTVRVKSYWTDEVKWVWDNLKDISFIKIIGKNILIYAAILVAIAGIYFLASLVIKKDTKFVKLLVATVTAFIPMMVVSIASPLLAMIYSPLGLIISVIGFVYTLIILLELMNEILVIENKNTRIYFHVACISILLIAGGFIAYKLLLGALSSSIGSLGSVLG